VGPQWNIKSVIVSQSNLDALVEPHIVIYRFVFELLIHSHYTLTVMHCLDCQC